MHARGINAGAHFRASNHIFASFVCVCAQIFTKIFMVVLFSVMSLSFKFHKDPIFLCGDICKMELWFFFGQHCMFQTILKSIVTALFRLKSKLKQDYG